ncbi:MAG TPA: tetratricopeptide repeat protein [Bacteroidales bacterium]|nr:tetratricopeptide repeat protein [Bacteroidales bacterium]HQI70882.1 tetratricopeptide repeat protein [Bacteroidales bacterium]
MKISRKIVLFSCVCLMFMPCFSCRTSRNAPETVAAENNKKLTQQQLLQNSALFLEGLREKYFNNNDKALGLFAQCIKQNPANDGALYEMGFLLFEQKKYDDALVLIKDACKRKPENIWYSLLLAQIYSAKKDFNNAEKVYKTLTDKNPDKPELFYEWADVCILHENYAEAIKVYDLLESRIGRQPETTLQKEKLYMQLGKSDKAIEEARALIRMFPGETQHYEDLADLYMATNQPLKAFEQYQKILSINQSDPNVHLALADYYRVQNNTEKAVEELKTAFASKELDIDSKVKILLTLMNNPAQNKDYFNALPELGKIVTESSPEEAKAFSVYGDILSQQKDLAGARNAFRKVTELDNSKYVVWQQLLQIDRTLEDYESLAFDSKTAMELFPEQPEPYLFFGLARMKAGAYEEAVTIMNTGKNFAIGDDKMLLKFYSALADSYYQIKKYDLCFESFEKSLSIDPNNTYVLNNYSYFLAMQNTNLGRAQQLSERLLSIYPDSPIFQDTYAWVLYKQKKYEEAKKWSTKAVSGSDEKNGGILEHHGDILYVLQEVEQAVHYWKKAKEAGANTEFLDKKIAEKKLYE